jgi:hypothetical protein
MSFRNPLYHPRAEKYSLPTAESQTLESLKSCPENWLLGKGIQLVILADIDVKYHELSFDSFSREYLLPRWLSAPPELVHQVDFLIITRGKQNKYSAELIRINIGLRTCTISWKSLFNIHFENLLASSLYNWWPDASSYFPSAKTFSYTYHMERLSLCYELH